MRGLIQLVLIAFAGVCILVLVTNFRTELRAIPRVIGGMLNRSDLPETSYQFMHVREAMANTDEALKHKEPKPLARRREKIVRRDPTDDIRTFMRAWTYEEHTREAKAIAALIADKIDVSDDLVRVVEWAIHSYAKGEHDERRCVREPSSGDYDQTPRWAEGPSGYGGTSVSTRNPEPGTCVGDLLVPSAYG